MVTHLEVSMSMDRKEISKRHREKLLSQGLCCVCKQKNNDNIGKLRCKNCTIGKAKIDNRNIRKSRLNSGLCTHCGINPHKDGFKRCQSCCDKQSAWYKQSNYREVNRILDKERRMERKKRIIQHYGGQCACCGEKQILFLSIDHINEDGAQHRAELAGKKGRNIGSSIFYKWIEKNHYPTDLQTLCFNCNIGKHINGGVCPHKLIRTNDFLFNI